MRYLASEIGKYFPVLKFSRYTVVVVVAVEIWQFLYIAKKWYCA